MGFIVSWFGETMTNQALGLKLLLLEKHLVLETRFTDTACLIHACLEEGDHPTSGPSPLHLAQESMNVLWWPGVFMAAIQAKLVRHDRKHSLEQALPETRPDNRLPAELDIGVKWYRLSKNSSHYTQENKRNKYKWKCEKFHQITRIEKKQMEIADKNSVCETKYLVDQACLTRSQWVACHVCGWPAAYLTCLQ